MAEAIYAARSVTEATRGLLASLVEQFQWDQAAVFTVEPDEADGGVIRLFAQCPDAGPDGARHRWAIPPGYTQPLYHPKPGEPFDAGRARQSGMLGAAIRAAAPLVAADTAEDENGNRPHFFHSFNHDHGSALAVPILLDGRVRWVLETISCNRNAFHAEDGARIGPLVQRLARMIASRRDAALSERLIARVEQGLVVTDVAGRLLRANARAREMLGLPQASDLPEGRRLLDHAADEATRSALGGVALTGAIRLGPLGGLGSDVRFQRFGDQTETRDTVWLLDGADEQDWIYDRTYIEATVQEVARQVRGPLLLAASLAGRLARGGSGAGVAERIVEEIGRADITFERLAESIGAQRDPRRRDDPVDLAEVIAEVVAALPARDRKPGRLAVHMPAQALVVLGDRDRLGFVVRTLLGHLLDCHPETVTVAGSEAGGRLRLRLTGAGHLAAAPAQAATPLEQIAQAARAMASAAQQTVGHVLQAHGGTLG